MFFVNNLFKIIITIQPFTVPPGKDISKMVLINGGKVN